MRRDLGPDDLRSRCDPNRLPFRSTAELETLDGMIGQQRALAATAFGIAMRRPGYNLFALGAPATGKTRVVRRVLADRARTEATPPDWCYVHDFADPYRPRAIAFAAGRGRAFAAAMRRLADECRTQVPRTFEGEEFERRKAQMLEELGTRQQATVRTLEEAANRAGFAIVRMPGGLTVTPVRDGKVLTPEDIAALSDAEREQIGSRAHGLEAQVDATMRTLRGLDREARTAHEQLVGMTAAAAVQPLMRELREEFPDGPALAAYLDQVERDLIEHAEEFRRLAEGGPPPPFMPPPGAFLERYKVNVLIDRTGEQGAPIVIEQNPTHANLLGRIEHHVQFGNLVTDFTLIKPGALHRANGGYLVLQAKDVLSSFLAWGALKKALTTKSIRIEEPLEELRQISTTSLAPTPIPLDVKVVLIGNPQLYYLLHALDEDFPALFKVKVDFDDSVPRDPDQELLLARFVADVCREDGLRHFAADGVARLVDHCARMVGDRDRLSARLGEVIDVLREASFCAEQAGRELVQAADVEQAIAQKKYRDDLVEERIARLTREGTLQIATRGEVVGQVNGLSVLSLGDHSFGRPVRITARTFVGEPGVIDIEREAKLGGRLHSKGVLVLSGFLAGRFARDRPLALAATLAFEQQYEEVDGDSASSAEVYALLSSLSGRPIAQRFAVTGSVNQRGDVQAIGGVNQKIEGFFDACAAHELTGDQGVLIPAANLRHLMLRPDVVEAVRAGRFRVVAVDTIDDGIEVLTGVPAGALGADGRFPEGTVNAAVDAALDRILQRHREQHASDRD